MKKTHIKFATIIVFMFFSTCTIAQTVTENSTAGGKIGKELAITEISSLHFGSMTVPSGAVNVILSTTNVRTASVPSNITLLAQAPIHQNAAYIVYGDHYQGYQITLPANNVVTIVSGANHMHVNSFLCRPASEGHNTHHGTLNASGEDTFTVGATLILLNAQPYGVYAGTFNAIVAYD